MQHNVVYVVYKVQCKINSPGHFFLCAFCLAESRPVFSVGRIALCFSFGKSTV